MADSKRKTANFVSMSEPQGDGYLANSVIGITGGGREQIISAPAFFVTEYIPVSEGTYYYYSDLYRATANNAKFMFYNANKEFIGYANRLPVLKEQPVYELSSFSAPANAAYMRMNIDKSSTKNCLYTSQLPAYKPYGWLHSLRKLTTATDTFTTLPADLYADGTNATVGLKGNMTQTGTPTPSSPIQPQECGDLETSGEHAGQYKIPISSASAITPVYLGEVQTTRKIKKYEFTGNESWSLSGSGYFYSTNSFSNYDHKLISKISTMWSHYIAGANNSNGQHLPNGYACLYCHATSAIASEVYIRDERYSTVADFKSYLAQQYSAGTPVTVWYVLAEPTTGIVNEPIRKIDDYADTVSGISIPTITGADSFDVQTTLKPSEVSLSYTGWHNASVKEWDGSQWNE